MGVSVGVASHLMVHINFPLNVMKRKERDDGLRENVEHDRARIKGKKE